MVLNRGDARLKIVGDIVGEHHEHRVATVLSPILFDFFDGDVIDHYRNNTDKS